MPVYKCSNKKWKIGKGGKCKYSSKEAAENAFKHWVETKESKEMADKINEKFELRNGKDKDNDDGATSASEIGRLMKMAGIEKRMEDNKDGEIDFDGMFTGVANGEIQVDESVSDEDLKMLARLAGLSEAKVKRSIFSKDQEHDRFSTFKKLHKSKYVGEKDDEKVSGGWKAFGFEKKKDKKSNVDEDNVIRGPWGRGGPKDPMVRDPQSPEREPDSAEIMDKYYELLDLDTDGSDAAMQVVSWVRDEFNVPEDNALGLVYQAFEDAGKDLASTLRGQAANEAMIPTVHRKGLSKEQLLGKYRAAKEAGKSEEAEFYRTAYEKRFGEKLSEVSHEDWERRWTERKPAAYYHGGEGLQEIWKVVKDAEAALGPLGRRRLDLVLDNFPISIEDADRILAKIEQLEKEEDGQRDQYYRGLTKGEFTRPESESIEEDHKIFRLVYPEARDVTADEIWGWYYDALADGEVDRVDSDDINAAIEQLEDIGRITIGSDRPGYPRPRGMAVENEFDNEEGPGPSYLQTDPQKHDPRDLIEIANSRLGSAVAEQLASLMGYDFKWGTWGGQSNPRSMEEQNSNALRYIAEFLRDRGEEEMGQEIETYLSQMQYGESVENPVIRQLQIEEAMKKSEFKKGSLTRLMIEMVVDEMKKGKSSQQISEELSFDPEEVFYIVEFFKNKKIKESKKENNEENTKESIKESIENKNLKRLRYLIEYKNTR